MFTDAVKHLRNAVLFLTSLVVIGTSGYMLIEGWNFEDSLYMVIITITTTGYGEVHPLSHSGQIFTLLLVVVSFATVIYIGGIGVQIIIESKIFRRWRVEKKIANLSGHYIVCGFGRMGRHICEELVEAKVPFVVIENNPGNIATLNELGFLFDDGDATNDAILERAGVKNAKGLVAVLSSDAENVFTTLSAKSINPKIFVVARAIEDATEPKLLKAGADRVVKPYELGGFRMASLLLRPGVADFIEIVAANRNLDLQIEEIFVKKGSKMHGKTLAQLPLRTEFNSIIVSIQNDEKGIFVYNPKGDIMVDEGNKLIAIGEKNNLERLKDF
jgi:voltage-gated potassium channel